MALSVVMLLVLSIFICVVGPYVNASEDAEPLAARVDREEKVRELMSKLPPALREKVSELLSQIEKIKTGENYIKRERIVVFKAGVPKDRIDKITARVSPVSVKDVAKYGVKGAEKVIKLLRFDSEDKAEQAESELKRDPDVLYVAKNFKVKVPPIKREAFKGQAEVDPRAPTADPFRSYQWYLFKTKEQFAPFAPTAPMVAVIDSGVQYDHPELAGRVSLGYDYVDDDADPYDENGHGTAVTGIIGAKVNNGIGIAGISPKSMIYAIRVLDETGAGTFEDVIAGIIEAADHPEVKVINLSLGGYVGYPSSEYDLIQAAVDYAVVTNKKILVSAAGNEANVISYIFDDPFTPDYDFVPVPAAVPNSFTAAATDEVDAKTGFSNYGTGTLGYVDIAAPGLRILTLDILGTYYVWYGGTSFSAPIVSAAAARVWGKNPGWTNTQVMNKLVTTGRALGPLRGFSVNTRRVNIAKALDIPLTGIQGQIIHAESPDFFYNTLGGVRVLASGPVLKYAFSNNGGFFTITGLVPGTYTLTVSKYGLVTQTRTGVIVAGGAITEDTDFYMVTVKPMDKITVVTNWNIPPLSYNEWMFNFFYAVEHPDLPQWQNTAGREMNTNFHILPDDIRLHPYWNPGDINIYPYAEIIVDSFTVERPVETLVYKPMSGKTYRFGQGMSPYDYCWGKILGSGAITRVFKGASLTNTISSATATGTADFWWHVYNQAGTAAISIINKRTPMFGVRAPTPLPTNILIDDDASGFGWNDYSYWFTSALSDAEYSYTYWDVFEAGPPSAADLGTYPVTIWFTGDDFQTTLTQYERSTLASYLSAAKKLFITGQDIGLYLNWYACYSWPGYPDLWPRIPSPYATSWYNTWLKAEYVFDKIDAEIDDYGKYGVLALTGINLDPISDPSGAPEGNEMMLAISNGDGADNQLYADAIKPIGGSTAVFYYFDEDGNIFVYGGENIAGGVRFPSPVPAPSTPYRLVYLSFGFEAISDAGTRAELIDEIIKFLNTGT